MWWKSNESRSGISDRTQFSRPSSKRTMPPCSVSAYCNFHVRCQSKFLLLMRCLISWPFESEYWASRQTRFLTHAIQLLQTAVQCLRDIPAQHPQQMGSRTRRDAGFYRPTLGLPNFGRPRWLSQRLLLRSKTRPWSDSQRAMASSATSSSQQSYSSSRTFSSGPCLS